MMLLHRSLFQLFPLRPFLQHLRQNCGELCRRQLHPSRQFPTFQAVSRGWEGFLPVSPSIVRSKGESDRLSATIRIRMI